MKVAGPGPRGKAYKIVVAGGRGPDLPLTPHSVPEIVRSALKERIPLVIDLFAKELSKADWRKIVQTAIHIIHYENEGGAVHVFLEEAAEFVPQKIYDGETYAEVEKLVRMGGNASVGITLINQRSQEVNKAVLDNCSTALILGCQVGKNAIESVEKWIERLDPKTAEELTQSLPKLQSGEAWVWTRKSLDRPTREKMPMCRSFHPDRRTPEIVLKSAKPTDTDEFVARLSNNIPKVIAEAKANDPAELKRKIAELTRELSKSKTKETIKEVPALLSDDRIRLKQLTDWLENFSDKAEQEVKDLVTTAKAIREEVGFFKSLLSKKLSTPAPTLARPPSIAVTADRFRPTHRKPAPDSEGNGEIGKGAREILKAAAQNYEGVTDAQLGVLTGYKKTSRTVFKQQLVSRGLLAKGGRGYMATESGIEFLGNDFEPLPTGQALRDHWLQTLSGGELALFKIYVNSYPKEVSMDELIEYTGYQKTSITVYRQKLTARNLIEGKAASRNLFE